MTVANRKGLAVDSGTTFDLSLHYLDSNRNPVDLTGFTATFSLFTPGKEGQPPYFTKTAGVTNDGWINVKVTDEETALWPLNKSAYRLELETPSGDKYRLVYGPLEVRSGVNV